MNGSLQSTVVSVECPECDGRLRQRRAETVCEGCGLVIGEDAIDHGPEWRSLDDDRDRRRTGAPLTETRHDRGLSTKIGFDSETGGSAERRRQLVRMRRQHNRSRFEKQSERNKVYAFTEIQRVVSVLSLSDSVCEQSCSLFSSAQSEDLLCGRTLEGFAAAVVYATCRTQSIARTIEEVVDVARAERSEFVAAFDALNSELGLPVGPISPTEYIPRYASAVGLPSPVERRAGELAVRLEADGFVSGKNPSGVAAACLYVAANDDGHDVTQCDVAEVANVSRMTIGSTVGQIDRYVRP